MNRTDEETLIIFKTIRSSKTKNITKKQKKKTKKQKTKNGKQ